MIKRAKVAYTGELLFGGVPQQEQLLTSISSDLVKDRAAFGVECGLLALEGARLLRSKKLTLAGRPEDTQQEGNGSILESAEYNGDTTAMQFVASSWASCARGSLRALSWTRDKADKNECSEWMDTLGKLVIAGLEDGIGALETPRNEKNLFFAIDAEKVTIECLRCVGILMHEVNGDVLSLGAVEHLANIVQERVVEPLLTTKAAEWSPQFIKQVCLFFDDLSELFVHRKEKAGVHDIKGSLTLILCPLDLMQRGHLGGDRTPLLAELINASQKGTATLVRNDLVPDILVKSLVDFMSNTLLQAKDEFSVFLHPAAKSLLLECFGHSSISIHERKKIALLMAQAGQWETWGAVYKFNIAEVEDRESLVVLKQSLLSAVGAESHLASFAAICNVVNGVTVECLAMIVLSIGCEVLGLLQHYGTLVSTTTQYAFPSQRSQCFAESIKVVLLFYQQALSADFLSQFLVTVFHTLIIVLRFNGLPLHPSGQQKGETGLGRLVAQTVLHIARTSPEAFKGSMAAMNEQDRSLLEFAVRGEMTGWKQSHPQVQTPAKKALNFKKFKK